MSKTCLLLARITKSLPCLSIIEICVGKTPIIFKLLYIYQILVKWRKNFEYTYIRIWIRINFALHSETADPFAAFSQARNFNMADENHYLEVVEGQFDDVEERWYYMWLLYRSKMAIPTVYLTFFSLNKNGGVVINGETELKLNGKCCHLYVIVHSHKSALSRYMNNRSTNLT